MRFQFLAFCAFFLPFSLFSQDFSGTWKGDYSGDNISLELKSTDKINWTGKMTDSQQAYEVKATRSGETLTGKATEPVLGLALDFTASVSGNTMYLKLSMLGMEMPAATLTRSVAANETRPNPKTENASPEKIGMPALPKNAQHDPMLIGVWKREENYNSGYGNAGYYASNSFMAFNADGTLSDLGGQTVVSGGDFSGNSSSAGSGTVPGVKWFSENRNLFLVATDGSRTETVKLGRYFIENGALLITADDGTKALYYRQ